MTTLIHEEKEVTNTRREGGDNSNHDENRAARVVARFLEGN